MESFTQKKGFAYLLRSLRLRPYDVIANGGKFNINLYNLWFDDQGNSITFKSKRIYINHYDLNIDKKYTINTDLYSHLPLSKIIKISKYIYILHGTDHDLDNDTIIITCLGIDDYFRSFVLYNGEIHKVPTLYLGLDLLLRYVNNTDIEYMKDLKVTEVKLFKNPKCFMFKNPPNKDVLLKIKLLNNKLFENFKS